MFFTDVSKIGTLGTTLYGALLVVSLCRLQLQCRPVVKPYFTIRKVFHMLMVFYSLFSLLAYAGFIIYQNYETWTYTLHIMSIFCEVSSFSLVAVLWSKTLLSAHNAYSRVIPFLMVVDLFFLVYIIVLCTDLLTTKQSFYNWANKSNFYSYMLLIEPIIIMLNGMMILYLGTRIYRKLGEHPHFLALPRYQKRSLLLKLIGTMIVCCMCFFCRGGLDIYLFTDGARGMTIDTWYLTNFFVCIVPAGLLLYSMRRTKQYTHVRQKSSNSDSNSNYLFKKLKKAMSGIGEEHENLTISNRTRTTEGNSLCRTTLYDDEDAGNEVTASLLNNSVMITEEIDISHDHEEVSDGLNVSGHSYHISSSHQSSMNPSSNDNSVILSQVIAEGGNIHQQKDKSITSDSYLNKSSKSTSVEDALGIGYRNSSRGSIGPAAGRRETIDSATLIDIAEEYDDDEDLYMDIINLL